jgi:hypothetical protein
MEIFPCRAVQGRAAFLASQDFQLRRRFARLLYARPLAVPQGAARNHFEKRGDFHDDHST